MCRIRATRHKPPNGPWTLRQTGPVAVQVLVLLVAVCMGGLGNAREARAQRAPGDGRPAAGTQPRHQSQNRAEQLSRLACENQTDRVFVLHAQGTECIAYYVTPAPAGPGATVFYFHGDLTAREVQPPEFTAGYLERMRRALAAIAARENVRFVDVDETFAIQADALERAIQIDLERGLKPCAIVASIGVFSATFFACAERHRLHQEGSYSPVGFGILAFALLMIWLTLVALPQKKSWAGYLRQSRV